MDARLAKRYASAIYNTAARIDAVDSVEADLKAIASLVKNDPSFRDFLFSPQVGKEEKLTIADKLFSDRVTATTMHAVRLILSKHREAELEGIYEEFVTIRREQGNVVYAAVSSAQEMTDDAKKRLIAKLETKTGRKVEADFKVEPALIGGAKVAFGNYVLDGTVRGSLNRLRDSLRRDLLKQN